MIVDVAEKPPIKISKLNESIGRYIGINSDKPYIFMNRETVNAMDSEFQFFADKKEMRFYNGFKVFYNGFKVFIDNSLPYGHVELR